MSSIGRIPVLFAFLIILVLSSAWAQTKPPKPQQSTVPALPFPRVEVGAHLDRPVDLAFDNKTNQLISVSDDRTIRFWNAQSGRLENTIHVPMSDRKDGELYAATVAADKRLLAVAGWTGYTWDKAISIYLFDLNTRQMVERVQQLPERVTALAFSDDSSRLAVALINGVVRMYNTDDWSLIQENRQCTTNRFRMHFHLNRLVTQCFDGKVQVFDSELNQLSSFTPLAEHQPAAVHWSPDGSRILIAYYDIQQLLIVDSQTGQLIRRFATHGLPEGVLPQAVWSADGRYIYAAGDVKQGNSNVVIRWDLQDETRELFPLAEKRIFRLLALPDGGVAYTSLEQAVGILDAIGETVFYQAPPIIDHSSRGDLLRISADGKTVSFALNNEGTRYQTFSLAEREMRISDSVPVGLRGPRHTARNMVIENWRDSSSPTLNGQPIPLYQFQRSRALAIAPDSDYFVLGLDSEMRRYQANGKLAWAIATMAGVRMANITADGKTIVAGLQDGSIRWYRAEDGEEFFALFAHRNERDWVAWTPPGFFISSPEGDRYMGWQLNNGKQQRADFYSAWQFERLLYRPDIVQDYFVSQGIWQNSNQFERFRSEKMRNLAPPDVELSVLEITERGTARIEVSARGRQLPIEQYTVYVNEVPVTPFAERRLADGERDKFQRRHEVPLSALQNQLRVEVLTQSSFQVANAFVDVSALAEQQKGDLYVLAIGVNELSLMPENNLNYAMQDALAVIDTLSQPTSAFDQVHVKILSDSSTVTPTRENVLQALSFLQNSTAKDTVILYIAAHGISNKAGDYFMIPADGSPQDMVNVIQNNHREADSLIRWDSFFAGLRNASGRRILIVDTCEAQKIKGNFDFGSLAKRSAAVAFGLLSASTGDEQSQEYPPANQGLFTYGLIQALQGKADINSDQQIDLQEIYQYTANFVQQNKILRELPQTPQMIASSLLQKASLRTIDPEPAALPAMPLSL